MCCLKLLSDYLNPMEGTDLVSSSLHGWPQTMRSQTGLYFPVPAAETAYPQQNHEQSRLAELTQTLCANTDRLDGGR